MPFTWLDVSSAPGAYVVLSSLVWLNIADFGFKAGFRVLWPIVRSLHAEMIIGSRGNVAVLSQLAKTTHKRRSPDRATPAVAG